jgi:cold-inducible RNA-binding protein
MGVKLYVGNLPFSTTNQDLHHHFSSYGTVASAQVILDRYTGRSRGFGFVEMSSQEEAEEAIHALNGTDLGGRMLVVNAARPPEARRPLGRGPESPDVSQSEQSQQL